MTFSLSGPSRIMNSDETLLVTRQPNAVGAGVTYQDGKPVRDPTLQTQYWCVCSVQPVPGQELLLLPEGDRHADMFYLWTQNRTEAPEIGDLVERGGRVYQTHDLDDWGNYTRCRVVYVDNLPPLAPT